jgi:DNA-binding sugar fermentation-stimulating protein
MLLKVSNVINSHILNRPSKTIKSPYVADVITENNIESLAHTPSLGCGGLTENGAEVWMTSIPQKSNKSEKCRYRVSFSVVKDVVRQQQTIVGVYPKYAEDLCEQALKSNQLRSLANIKFYKRETVVKTSTLEDSRFDFTGIDENDIPFIMEIKNVPLADYEDNSGKKKKNPNSQKSSEDRLFNSKVAYFPDGYRKKGSDTVSPRALKHLKTLTEIKKRNIDETRCILCYILQRNDTAIFKPAAADPIYHKAFYEAIEAGVEVLVLVIEWKILREEDGSYSAEAYLVRDDLPIAPANFM